MATPRKDDLALILSEGEGQRIEFKEKPSKLDREMVALTNASGGSIYLGLTDRAEVLGNPITMIEETVKFVQRNMTAKHVIANSPENLPHLERCTL